MRKEFVMRGQTESYNPSTGKGGVETLNFSGFKPGMAYKMTEFSLYPSTGIGSADYEYCATLTAGKTAITPTDPNFNNEALIASVFVSESASTAYPVAVLAVINDTFLITQNLILMVQDTSGASNPINWQCRFEAVKMSGPEEAVTNYKQFAISDE